MKVFTDGIGRVYVTTAPAVAADPRTEGIAFTNSGQMRITATISATDTRLAGLRISATGQLVVGDGVIGSRPYVGQAGLPFDKRNGALIRQVDTVPAATDPFVAGVRVGPRGGVYFSTATPVRRRTAVIA